MPTDISDTTILPFMNALTAAKIFGIIVAVAVALYVIRAVVYKKALGLRRGPTAVFFYGAIAITFNTALYTFFYWKWALPVSVVITLVYMSATWHEVKEGNSEERVGVWGLNKDIRTVRGEIFNDMTKEEQLEYTGKVKEYKFWWPLFIAVCVATPILIALLWKIAGLGFLWSPVVIG